MTDPVRLAVVGLGKIARDQHLPAIANSPGFSLVAIASFGDGIEDVPCYPDLSSLLAGKERAQAVALCTPPGGRHDLARMAIDAGVHVLLEKPPAVTLSEMHAIAVAAKRRGVTLMASWHSREAGGVDPAREWLSGKAIKSVRIDWKEDIRRWHPGQEWILDRCGFGVFDPGINALSIVSRILPEPITVRDAQIEIPRGREAPLRAELTMDCAGAPIIASFDFLNTGPQIWDIAIDTDHGSLKLGMGGSILSLPDEPDRHFADEEYARLYRRFADLIVQGESDADFAPSVLVADALTIARRQSGPAFSF